MAVPTLGSHLGPYLVPYLGAIWNDIWAQHWARIWIQNGDRSWIHISAQTNVQNGPFGGPAQKSNKLSRTTKKPCSCLGGWLGPGLDAAESWDGEDTGLLHFLGSNCCKAFEDLIHLLSFQFVFCSNVKVRDRIAVSLASYQCWPHTTSRKTASSLRLQD